MGDQRAHLAELVGKLTSLGYEVAVEPGAGLGSLHDDQEYVDAGAVVTESALEGAGYEIHDDQRYDWAKDDLVIVHTDSVRLHVQSVLDDSLARADIRDIKPQQEIPVPLPAWLWVLVGALAALGGLAWWLLRRRRREAGRRGPGGGEPKGVFALIFGKLEFSSRVLSRFQVTWRRERPPPRVAAVPRTSRPCPLRPRARERSRRAARRSAW